MASTTKKRKVGKPPINDKDDVKAIQKKIDDYFNSLIAADGDRIEPTFCGLALALGYCQRKTLWENAKAESPISTPIKKAMLRVEESYERALRYQSCTGAIFALKNRGWSDKAEGEEENTVKLDAILEGIKRSATD
jgi:hypothetical protein